MEKENNINSSEEEIKNNIPQPNWFVCFFLVLANYYLSGFIGKSLVTGEKCPDRLVSFIANVFFLIINSLPIALFVSYFLITLPTWLFVLVVASMAVDLLNFVFHINQEYLTNRQKQTEQLEESKVLEEKSNNHAKFYLYGSKYYKNRPTTLIGDFFRTIGDICFSGFFGKRFMLQRKIKREYRLMLVIENILTIIFNLCLWSLIVSCFLITLPKWLFVLAIAAMASMFVIDFCAAHLARQALRQEIFFCKCDRDGKNTPDNWHASPVQVKKEFQCDDVPDVDDFSDTNDIMGYCYHKMY